MKNYRPPVKPAKLDDGCVWASVVEIHDSDGCGPYEKTWTCEMMGYQWGADVAREAAKTWWEDTDQSGECELTVLIERWDGVQKRWRMKVTMEVKARVVR